MKTYEGMFVVDSKECKKSTENVEEQIQALIAKCGGEVKEFLKWDERKLAYEMMGNTSGTYYLSFFTGDSDTIQKLNRECRLSPVVLRALFLNIKEIPEIEPERIRGYEEDGVEGEAKATVPASEPVEKAETGLIDDAPDMELSSSETEIPELPGEVETAPAESDEEPDGDVADEEEDRDR